MNKNLAKVNVKIYEDDKLIHEGHNTSTVAALQAMANLVAGKFQNASAGKIQYVVANVPDDVSQPSTSDTVFKTGTDIHIATVSNSTIVTSDNTVTATFTFVFPAGDSFQYRQLALLSDDDSGTTFSSTNASHYILFARHIIPNNANTKETSTTLTIEWQVVYNIQTA